MIYKKTTRLERQRFKEDPAIIDPYASNSQDYFYLRRTLFITSRGLLNQDERNNIQDIPANISTIQC